MAAGSAGSSRLASVAPIHGPGAVAWRVNGERLMLLGWTRAILMQLAHPLIAAGVHEHSSFRADPRTAVIRLRHTVQAMLALTFGNEAEQARAYEGIRAIHRRVNGRLPAAAGRFAAGTPYSAEDPDLVLWVHVTLLESIPLVYERLIAPLGVAELDAYCADAARVALALGARDADVPRSWAGARRHIDATCSGGTIAVTPQALELSHALLAPRFPLAAPAAWINRLFTLGDLPPSLRDQYGLTWTPSDERAFTRITQLIRGLRAGTPGIVALWPQARIQH
jgi:uncharacterized protein (DUF2236 family)